MKSIDELLAILDREKGSDLHLAVGIRPCIRINGVLVTLPEDPLQEEEMKMICHQILSDVQMQTLQTMGDADAAYTCSNPLNKTILRARVNIFKDSRGLALAVRLINETIPSMKSLLLPQSLIKLTDKKHGFVIVTGPTGSGKTTTLASMIDYINENQPVHIITLEDPVEFMYREKKAIISQREIGKDCASFHRGLEAALREDPDVILVGEMRDAETIATALSAAETGHLVFATLHTANVIEAMDRLLQYFPAERHDQMRKQLANCMEGVVAQKLLPGKRGGRVAAFEILLKNDAVLNLIRTGESFRLPDYMRAAAGMQTMDDSLKSLRNLRLID